MRRAGIGLVALVLLVTGCATGGKPPPGTPSGAPRPPVEERPGPAPSSERDAYPRPDEVPPDVVETPDAVPREEPRSRSGNSAQYEVLGKRYRVMESARGFRERGKASWYGKKFHGRRTASGEVYDMYKMTAAHKTLPLPSYVRVRNLQNDRSVVVRVNDRGPFHRGRIIDLSYTAAAKLGFLSAGFAEVEIEVVTPGSGPQPPPPPEPTEESPGQGWLQVAAYADPINAVVLREELQKAGHENAQILAVDEGGEAMHRVVIGPFARRDASDATRERLQSQGRDAVWLSTASDADE
ncbi:MAG TPA: septal ring lytic transglycosylase RlpA family protein [Solimonas sp.]|nr:septal ring lytic transglycosylase RlpA family protein [Solimonas sp.]